MLYLVGGCSRSGKSVLAERMRVRHGVPWFPLDALTMGLARGAPALGIDPDADDLLTADRLWPIVRGLLQHFLVDGRNYLVEGAHLRPAAAAGLITEHGAGIRTCFLGYPALTPGAKADLVRRFSGLPNDWLATMDADYVEGFLRHCVDISAGLQRECARVDLPFFDTGQDFETALDAAERSLMSP